MAQYEGPLEGEEWRPVVGYEKRYAISNLGRVRNIWCTQPHYIGRLLNSYIGTGRNKGYLRVGLWKEEGRPNAEYVHKLVANAFLGLCPEGMEVNHKDGVRTNPKLDNLEYVTRSENLLHSYRVTKLSDNAKKDWSSICKLTNELVVEIRARAAAGEKPHRLAKEYKMVGRSSVYRVVRGATWKNI